jgi:hypothetical protein
MVFRLLPSRVSLFSFWAYDDRGKALDFYVMLKIPILNDDERIDRRYDQNRNGQLDRRVDRNNDNRLDRSRGNDRWTNNWRNDRRYDWRNHRQSNSSYYRPGRYYSPYRGHSYSRISIGFSLGSGYYGSRYWINDPWEYRLPAAYGTYRWVRYYDDVLLVDIRNGRVVDVIRDFFW